MISDTKWNPRAIKLAKDATLLLCESTYLDTHKALAESHHHLTAKQAAEIAKEANAKMLVLTHFSARYQDLAPFLQEARAIFPNTHVAEDLKYFDFPY
jgi:ribonuclease Z